VLSNLNDLGKRGQTLGGFGSGRHWFSKKTTVEECLTLNIEEFTSGDLLRPTSWAELRWYRGREETASVDYSLKDIGFKEGRSAYVLTLHSPLIRRGQRIPITQGIPLLTTQLRSGGKRYWFSCPNCKRRVGRLHLPYGMSYFLCRRCYDLTYMSCQESHKFDWFFAEIGVHPSVGRRLFKRN
jgi:hypothetical protein